MKYVSTFLSHNFKEKRLVEAVSIELGRRGIISWLDKNELVTGSTLSIALNEAIKRQATVTVFLSNNSVTSKWVKDELISALKSHSDELILPIVLGDMNKLITSIPELKRWIHTDGERIDKQVIVINSKMRIHDKAIIIADKISKAIFGALDLKSKTSLIAYIDQRGKGGNRTGELNNLPESLKHLDIPMLVFRPDNCMRSPGEVLSGEAWTAYWQGIRSTLCEIIGSSCIKKDLYLAGGAQLAIPFFLGRVFDRNTSINLHCHIRQNDELIDNANQDRSVPLSIGNSSCETKHVNISDIPVGVTAETISLLLLRSDLIDKTLAYLDVFPDSSPSVWVSHDRISTNDDAWKYIENTIALIMRLKKEHGVRVINLFTSLPFHILPILSANLLHVVDDIQFMEFCRSETKLLSIQETYVPLKDE